MQVNLSIGFTDEFRQNTEPAGRVINCGWSVAGFPVDKLIIFVLARWEFGASQDRSGRPGPLEWWLIARVGETPNTARFVGFGTYSLDINVLAFVMTTD